MAVMNFGTAIRELRQEAYARDNQINITSVSDALGITKAHLMNVERGVKAPFDKDKIKAFCQFLNIPEKEDELQFLALTSRSFITLNLNQVSRQKQRLAMVLAREWDDPNSQIMNDFIQKFNLDLEDQ